MYLVTSITPSFPVSFAATVLGVETSSIAVPSVEKPTFQFVVPVVTLAAVSILKLVENDAKPNDKPATATTKAITANSLPPLFFSISFTSKKIFYCISYIVMYFLDVFKYVLCYLKYISFLYIFQLKEPILM